MVDTRRTLNQQSESEGCMAGKRQDEQWEARLTSIVDTGAELFAERGYHGVGIADLCTAADVGRGTLYYYIDSKENLLSLIHDRVMDQLVESMTEVVEMDAKASEKLLLLGKQQLDIVDTYPNHVTVALHEYKALTGEHRERFRSRRRQVAEGIEAVLQQGIDDGEFEIDNIRLAALGWLGMHNYSYIWYRHGGPDSPEHIAEVFGQMYFNGVNKN